MEGTGKNRIYTVHINISKEDDVIQCCGSTCVWEHKINCLPLKLNSECLITCKLIYDIQPETSASLLSLVGLGRATKLNCCFTEYIDLTLKLGVALC